MPRWLPASAVGILRVLDSRDMHLNPLRKWVFQEMTTSEEVGSMCCWRRWQRRNVKTWSVKTVVVSARRVAFLHGIRSPKSILVARTQGLITDAWLVTAKKVV